MSLVATDADNGEALVHPQPSQAGVRTNQECLKATYRLLAEFQLATPAELASLAEEGQGLSGGERQLDPLEIIARCRVDEPDERPQEIERLGRLMCTALQRPLVLPPFVNRLPSPSGFYDGNPGLLEECQALMTPILYAEDTEVIGIGSINPIALEQSAQRIISILGERTGTNPIVSPMLLTHDGWVGMCHKQLGI